MADCHQVSGAEDHDNIERRFQRVSAANLADTGDLQICHGRTVSQIVTKTLLFDIDNVCRRVAGRIQVKPVVGA